MTNVLSKQATVIGCGLLLLRQRCRRRNRRFWIHPLIEDRSARGQYYVSHKYKENPDKFFECYHMSLRASNTLLHNISNAISGGNTRLRDCIGPEEKLAITLWYLATGCSIRVIHLTFLYGRSTISKIIRETCSAIWDTMKDQVMKQCTAEDWLNISDQFERKANFPHCDGSIDGKHITIINPWGASSEYYNYKKYFSIVLMAVVDANYCFRYIDAGSFGHEGDSNIFKCTRFGKKLYSKSILLAQLSPLPNDASGENQPYVFLADEAFALNEHLLRPYPGKDMNNTNRIFNYRLSRARRYVECAFGMLANKWRILHHRPINVSIDLVDIIVKASCILHNFVRENDGVNFEDTLTCSLEGIPALGTRGNMVGKHTRDHFAEYFCSPAGAVPWQNHYANIV